MLGRMDTDPARVPRSSDAPDPEAPRLAELDGAQRARLEPFPD